MGIKELLVVQGEPNEKFLEIEGRGFLHRLEIAQTDDQLAEAKALDDLAFGAHLGITMEELTEIMKHGAVLLLRDLQGNLIGETQIITSPIPQHENLAPEEAYNYGTAVHPDFQNHGIAQILFKGQELIALEAGKIKNTLTARLENAQSLRGRFKSGYQVGGYDPKHYGPLEEDGARLIMEKDHLNQGEVFTAETLAEMFKTGEVLVVDQDGVDQAIHDDKAFIGIEVKCGDKIDFTAHNLVSKIFDANKFVGVGLLKPSEFNSNKESSLLVFKHK